jgi:CheY-like chemotaxis protein
MAENKKLVLVVDDEPDTLAFFSTLLEDHGYAVAMAKDGAEALRRVQERRPDLVTLDITMPEKSGVRFYRDLRESAEWKGIPIVIITGISGDFERFISTRKQVPPPEGYLSKPVDQEKLLETVRKLIG